MKSSISNKHRNIYLVGSGIAAWAAAAYFIMVIANDISMLAL